MVTSDLKPSVCEGAANQKKDGSNGEELKKHISDRA